MEIFAIELQCNIFVLHAKGDGFVHQSHVDHQLTHIPAAHVTQKTKISKTDTEIPFIGNRTPSIWPRFHGDGRGGHPLQPPRRLAPSLSRAPDLPVATKRDRYSSLRASCAKAAPSKIDIAQGWPSIIRSFFEAQRQGSIRLFSVFNLYLMPHQ